MSKFWVPVGGLHTSKDEVLKRYVETLDALCDNVNSKQFPACSCPIPDTLVLHDAHVHFYFYDWAAQCVRRNAPKVQHSQSLDRLQRPRARPAGDWVVHPDRESRMESVLSQSAAGGRGEGVAGNEAILSTFINPPSVKSLHKEEESVTVPDGSGMGGGGDPNLNHNNENDSSCRVVASRLFEVEDGGGRGGWRVATEYFTQDGLESFVRNQQRKGEKGRITILQRFIGPRPYKGIQDFSQSIFSHYVRQQPNSVSVVRTVVNGVPLGSDASVISFTDGSPPHPTLRACVYPAVAFQGRCTSERTVPIFEDELPAHRVESVEGAEGVYDTCLAMSKYVSHALERRRKASNPEAYSNGRDVRPVSAIVLEFKLSAADGYLYLANVQAVRHTADIGGLDSSYQLTLASVSTSSRNVSRAVKNNYAAFHLEFSTNNIVCQEVVGRRRGGRGAVSSFVDDSSSASDPSENDEFRQRVVSKKARCPNCCLSVLRSSFVSVRIRDILGKLKVRGASHRRSHSAPAAVAVGLWSELPQVIQGLSSSVEDMLSKPVWLNRCVNVCDDCRMQLGVELEEVQDRSAKGSLLSQHIGGRHQRSLQQRSQPPFAHSEGTDAVVTTELQVHHRRVRRVERTKYQHRFPEVCKLPRPYSAASRSESILTTPASTPRQRTTRPTSVGSSPYHIRTAAISSPHDTPISSSHRGVGVAPPPQPRPLGGGQYRHQLGKHSEHIDTSFLRPQPPSVPKQAPPHPPVRNDDSTDNKGLYTHTATSATIGQGSNTFANLSEDERALVYEAFEN